MIGLEEIVNARKIMEGRIHRTPLISSMNLGKQTNTQLYFKPEVFQKTGSFKVRGALNKLNSLTPGERKRGVITVSSGNHAQGVAYSASQLGMKAVVVMPDTTDSAKVNATKGYGAEVVLTDQDLFQVCAEIQKKRNLTMVHPFDDPYIIAGQGTIGLEIVEELPDIDVVFVQIGGGGLIAGVATAIKSKKPKVKIIGVEPTGCPSMYESLKQKKIVRLDKVNTIADGLASEFTGELNLALTQKYVDDVVLVSDDELINGIGLLLEWCKVLTEPSGVASFAALYFKKAKIPAGAKTVCILSGGNISRKRLADLLLKEKPVR